MGANRSPGALILLLFCLTLPFIGGCKGKQPEPDFIARVGNDYLTHEDLNAALSTLPQGTDSTEAEHQFVEQWVTNALLYQEARRRGLQDDADVQHLLAESERSVMVNALLSRIYKDEPSGPTPAEISAYYDEYKGQLRLREPFVRVRYLAGRSADSMRVARRLMQALPDSSADSAWTAIVNRFSTDVQGALDLSRNFYPESHLFIAAPKLHDALAGLRDGRVSDIVERDSGRFAVVQLIERVPAGTVPQLAWIQDELAQRVAIHLRKQMYAREVQHLRNEALAREALVVPE